MNKQFIEIYGTEVKRIISKKIIKSLEIYDRDNLIQGAKILELHLHFFGNEDGEVGFLEGNSYHSINYFFNSSDILLLRLYTYEFLEIQIIGDQVWKDLEKEEAAENGS
jgi:hypothetical protein